MNSLEFSATGRLAEIVSNMTIDVSSIEDQQVNDVMFNWYKKRIDRCREDDCVAAIQPYLMKLLKDERVNDITRSHIIIYANKGEP